MYTIVIPNSSTSSIIATSKETTDIVKDISDVNAIMLIKPNLVHDSTYLIINESIRIPIQPFVPYIFKVKIKSIYVEKLSNFSLTNLTITNQPVWKFFVWNSCFENIPQTLVKQHEKVQFTVGGNVEFILKEWHLSKFKISYYASGGSLSESYIINEYDVNNNYDFGIKHYFTIHHPNIHPQDSIEFYNVDSLHLDVYKNEGTPASSCFMYFDFFR